MYQALYRKWRPRTFDEVVGQPHVTETLKRQMETDRVSHAYLFIGTRGTGKTSCAKILAKAVNCEHPQGGNPCNACPSCLGIDSGGILDVEELDAASNNGVDHVRALRDEAVYTPASVKKRVYIIDEVHMLSTAAFNALLKILEEPPAHLVFILATTEAHKVPATILSRCQRYAFKRVGAEDISGRLREVAEKEGMELLDDAAELLSRLADGSMRDALALLDQCAMGRPIDAALVLDVVGLAGNAKVAELLTAVAGRDVESALGIVNALYYDGKDMSSLLNELSTLLRDILLTRIAPKGGRSLLSGAFEPGVLSQYDALPPERLLAALGQVQTALDGMGQSANRKLTAELCVIRLCDERLSEDLDALRARLARLEGQVQAGAPVPAPAPERAAPSVPKPAEDTPPWAAPEEEASPPPEPVSDGVEPEPAPSAAAPSPPPAAPSGDVWASILAAVESEIDYSIYTLISDGKEVKAVLDGSTLNIYIENAFTKLMAETKEVLAALKASAQAVTGNPVVIKMQSGSPPSAGAGSKLDALTKKGFDNITIK